LTDVVQVGTNGGTAYTRPGTVPARSGDAEALIRAVQREGDAAVRRFILRFDGRLPRQWACRPALGKPEPGLLKALRLAASRIRRVAEAQLPREKILRDGHGEIRLRVQPLDRVGVYVPGGRYPLLSTVLMGVIPARVAGVREVIVCTPHPSPGILAAAAVAGADRVFAIGGAQAIAAMACGTRTVPKVDTLVGPGNRYVAAAKQAVRDLGLCGIDGVAGPSELLAIVDDSARPDWIASDLLAQAEHDPEAKVALATPSSSLAHAVIRAVEAGLNSLPTRRIAAASLRKARVWKVRSMAEAVALAEATAPEHLLLWCRDANRWLPKLKRAGTVFVGPYSSVAFGDYVNGPNHTLPTDGTARWASGLSVLDFLRVSAVQTVSRAVARRLGPAARRLAEAEGLIGHRDAVWKRER
jgi:histidinol dehydrogenase